MKYFIILSTAFVAALSTACGQTSQHNHSHNASSTTEYRTVKPGAAVQMQHNYDGATAVGEIETLSIEFTHTYDSGQIDIQLYAQEGLDIVSGKRQISVNAETAQYLLQELAVSAAQDGRYKLYALVSVSDKLGNRQSRSFGIDIIVGDAAQQKAKDSDVSTMPNGEKIIQMPAQQL